MPKLSIITINLNNAIGLQKTIDSVVGQLFADYEYIIIDGGSTDGSFEVIKEYESRITFWVSEPDKGIYNAMNKGILQSKGEFLLFLNSGDWLVDKDVLQYVFNQAYEADILYGDIYVWFREGIYKRWTFKNETIDLAYFYKTSIAHPASFIKRELFLQELYDENYKIVSDWKFFIKKIVIEGVIIQHVDLPVSYFDSNGISSTKNMQELVKKEMQDVLNSLFPPLVLSSIKEMYEINNFRPVKDILEIKKFRRFSYFVFLFNRISISLYKRMFLNASTKNH